MSKPCVSVFPNYLSGVGYVKELLRNLIFSELIAWSRSNVDHHTLVHTIVAQISDRFLSFRADCGNALWLYFA